MYGGRVANKTIYIPDALADQLRRHEINVSATCRTALEHELRLAQRRLGRQRAKVRRELAAESQGVAA
jgi:post-segregation antitoxin (ccd killing protein)